MFKLVHMLRTWRRQNPALGFIILGFACLQLVAMGWDLPGAYGWENDGVAPRDLFGGLANNLRPGHAHRYPLFHYLILGILCLPIALVAALRADSLTMAGLSEHLLAVPTMTAISLVAKLVTITMACIAIATLARIARRTVSKRAGVWAAVFAATSISISYYGRVSNLDIPYLMWTALALNALCDLAERGRFRDYVWFALFTAAAVATKDQAYAGFVLVGPVYLIARPTWGWLRHRGSRLGDGLATPPARHWQRLGAAIGIGALALGILGGGLLNPTGFRARLDLLTGPNSQDWRGDDPGLAGMLSNLRDLAALQAEYWWPWPVLALAWLGVVLAWRRPRSSTDPLKRRAWRLLPLVAGLSSLIFFTLVVGRTGHRFVLPLGLWLSYYGGVSADWVLTRCARWRQRASVRPNQRDQRDPHDQRDQHDQRDPHGSATQRRLSAGRIGAGAVRAGLFGLMAWAAAGALLLVVTQWGDARRQVTRILADQPAGTVVETYGLLVYLPHFDLSPSARYRVERVGPRPAERRNPLLGAREVAADYGLITARRPDIIVIPEAFARRFATLEERPGQRPQAVMAAYRRASDGPEFFAAALSDTLPGYQVSAVLGPYIPAWLRALGARPLAIHTSTAQRIWLLERTEP